MGRSLFSLETFSTCAFRQVSPDRLDRLRSIAGSALAAHAAPKAGREPLRPHDYRMLFFCRVSCRTLRQAMQRAGEFVSLLNPVPLAAMGGGSPCR